MRQLLEHTQMLVAFDFDRTLVDTDSEAFVLSHFGGMETLTRIMGSRQNKPFETINAFASYAIKFLFAEGLANSTREIDRVLHEIPIVSGMLELLRLFHSKKAEIVIISDSNEYFIERVLEKMGVRDMISKIIANPVDIKPLRRAGIEASFQDDSKLQENCNLDALELKSDCQNEEQYFPLISALHKNIKCSFDICPSNMCKGNALCDYIKSEKLCAKSLRVVYVGDGLNDLCPMLASLISFYDAEEVSHHTDCELNSISNTKKRKKGCCLKENFIENIERSQILKKTISCGEGPQNNGTSESCVDEIHFTLFARHDHVLQNLLKPHLTRAEYQDVKKIPRQEFCSKKKKTEKTRLSSPTIDPKNRVSCDDVDLAPSLIKRLYKFKGVFNDSSDRSSPSKPNMHFKALVNAVKKRKYENNEHVESGAESGYAKLILGDPKQRALSQSPKKTLGKNEEVCLNNVKNSDNIETDCTDLNILLANPKLESRLKSTDIFFWESGDDISKIAESFI